MASTAAWQVSDRAHRRFRICYEDAYAVATAKRLFGYTIDAPARGSVDHPQSAHFNALEILSRSTAAAWLIPLHRDRICMRDTQTKDPSVFLSGSLVDAKALDLIQPHDIWIMTLPTSVADQRTYQTALHGTLTTPLTPTYARRQRWRSCVLVDKYGRCSRKILRLCFGAVGSRPSFEPSRCQLLTCSSLPMFGTFSYHRRSMASPRLTIRSETSRLRSSILLPHWVAATEWSSSMKVVPEVKLIR